MNQENNNSIDGVRLEADYQVPSEILEVNYQVPANRLEYFVAAALQGLLSNRDIVFVDDSKCDPGEWKIAYDEKEIAETALEFALATIDAIDKHASDSKVIVNSEDS